MRVIAIVSLLALAAAAPAPKTPTEIVAAAPASAWKTIPSDDLLVMQLASGRKVVIQLAPAFAPVDVANQLPNSKAQ
jgi:peptidylprolyl isomerase